MVSLGRIADAAGDGIGDGSDGHDVFPDRVETDVFKTAAVAAVAGGVGGGVIGNDRGAAGREGHVLAVCGVVGTFVAGAAENQIVGGVECQRVAIPGVGVVNSEVRLDGGGRGAGAVPFPNAGAIVDIVPAADVAITVVRQLDFAGLSGCGSAAGGHLGGVAVPIVAVHQRAIRHAAGGGINAGGDKRAADVSGMIDRGGAVHHGDAGAEFLVGGAGGATIPETDGHAGARERVRRAPEQIGPGGDGGVDIFGGEIKRFVTRKAGDFLDAAVWQNRAQRQAKAGGFGAGRLAAAGFDFRHACHHPGAVDRSGKVDRRIGEQVGEGFLAFGRADESQCREHRAGVAEKSHTIPNT